MGGKSALNLLAWEETLLRALKDAGARSVIGVCEQEETCRQLARVQGVRMMTGNAESLPFGEGEMGAVVMHLPKSGTLPSRKRHLRAMLKEARRVLSDGGRVVIVGIRAQADNAISRAPGLDVADAFDVLLSGRKCSVWILERRRMRDAVFRSWNQRGGRR